MKYRLLGVAVATAMMHGCASYSMQTATAPISAAVADQIVDGQTTRFDLISILGEPNGFSMGMGAVGMVPMQRSQQMQKLMKAQLGDDESTRHLMHYKNCVVTAKASVNIILPIGHGSRLEVCKVLTALLDDNDVVIAHVYMDNNFVTKEKIAKIKPKLSTRKDVILTLGGPTSVSSSGDREIYLYRNCLGSTGVSNFGMYKQENLQSCQQAGVAFDGNGVVQRVNFIPWKK